MIEVMFVRMIRKYSRLAVHCVLLCGFLLLNPLAIFSQLVTFAEVQEEFYKDEPRLRKWDAAVVADLDQDGFLDLILNDHGFGIRICWNNEGDFEKPYDLIMGDIHGVSVGDFDGDQKLEIIVSRGGGSGSNARNSKIFKVDRQRQFTALPDFNIPLEMMRGRTVKFFDGDQDGDLDLINFAFPSKEKKGESENYIYENDGQGQLILKSKLPFTKGDGQKTLLTDFNGDHILDLILYGAGSVQAFKGKGDLSFEDVSQNIFPFPITEVTSIVELDYDNDGDFDLFFTRGQDFEKGETFYNGQTQIFGFATKRGKFNFDQIKSGDVLQLENYHTQWPQTNQLYIGETAYDYEHPGETHSGKDIRLVNSDALGFPDDLSKKGIYMGYIGNKNWRIAGNIWGPLTAVIRGVAEYPEYDHPPGKYNLLLENDQGQFIDKTEQANLLFEEHCTGTAVADVDNNGFSDLIISRRGDLIHPNQSQVFLNKGEGQFQALKNHKIVSKELGAIGLGVEVLDYNRDGKMDVVIGNERGNWHLFKNTSPSNEKNNFINIEVGNSPSGNATALGAIVSIKHCEMEQMKRVGATGANYSLSFNHLLHFGLGECKGPIELEVIWTNGERKAYSISKLNKTMTTGGSH